VAPYYKMARTKKVKSSGSLGAGFGTRVRTRLVAVESKQRKKQLCPFCNRLGIKRKSAGIWKCPKCNKVFASNAYIVQ